MKTHYELLGLERSADADAIKRAFRREIARYHPDKVIHLGAEFQEMAATRAAELTVAYKTLTDSALREAYDAAIAAGPPPEPPSVEPRLTEPLQPPAVENIAEDAPPVTGRPAQFAAERAGRDLILKRVIAERVRAAVESLYGTLQTPAVRGFDLTMVPLAKPRILGSHPPRVLVKVVDVADGPAVTDAFAAASRAGVHSGKSPVVVLLFAKTIAAEQELSKAHGANARQRKAPEAPHEVAVVVVDTADWSCRLPPDCSAAVQKLTARICS